MTVIGFVAGVEEKETDYAYTPSKPTSAALAHTQVFARTMEVTRIQLAQAIEDGVITDFHVTRTGDDMFIDSTSSRQWEFANPLVWHAGCSPLPPKAPKRKD